MNSIIAFSALLRQQSVAAKGIEAFHWGGDAEDVELCKSVLGTGLISNGSMPVYYLPAVSVNTYPWFLE